MKRWIVWILIAVLVVGLGLGVFFGVRSCNQKTQDNVGNYKVYYMKDKYKVGETVIGRVIMTSNKQMVKMTYSINNTEEVDFTTEYGESKNATETVGNGKYFIDTDAEIIPSDNLVVGWYTLVVYSYDADGTRYVVTPKPILFQIVGTTTAA